MDIKITKVAMSDHFEFKVQINEHEPIWCRTWQTVLDVLTETAEKENLD